MTANEAQLEGSRFLTFAEVCGRLRISPKTARKIIQSGDLEATTVGGNNAYRVTEQALADYIAARTVRASA
jgi:excisionase family DNA binding protein